MAMYIFTKNIINGEEIPVFNDGDMKRDFTFIDDIIYGLRASLDSDYQCEVFNLGNNKSENLMDMIKIIEEELNSKAKIQFYDMQPGDVRNTFADISHAKELLGYSPKIAIEEGIPKFIDWYKFYCLKK